MSLSAVGFGTLSAAQIRLVDWHTTATGTVRTRVLIVHEVSALVLTPLVVGVFLLAGFYLLLLPSAFTLLWRPHVLMDRRRDQILKPVARAFNAAMPGPNDGDLLAARSDRQQELASQLKLLDDACPAWPLRVRRLRPVVVTAVLPIVVAVASKLMTT